VDSVQLAAVLAAAVLLASVISIEIGLSVALVELALGVAFGNAFGLDANSGWLVFVANFASVVLTFLAGAEAFWSPSRCSRRRALLALLRCVGKQ
jgi:Kef-type K+ transport system membrane component KefB